MDKTVVVHPRVLCWLRESILDSHISTFLTYLRDRRYAKRTQHSYLCAAGHFARWLSLEKARLPQLDEQVVRRFLSVHLPHCSCPYPVLRTKHEIHAALRHLLGKEPRRDGAAPDAPSLLFDWTALETAAECLKLGFPAWPAESGLPIVVASSEKAVTEIPDNRRPLYEELLRSGVLHVESIMPGSRAAAFLRQRQAVFGDALVILGGGTGVEHLADLYLSRRKPVVPLDLALGASRDDGTGGAVSLAKEARAEPVRFFLFSPAYANTEGAALAEIATRAGAAAAADVASRTLSLLTKIERPSVFYVRLLNPAHAKFKIVESFFREVVDTVVDEAGMRRVEIGTDDSDYAFINVGIFENLHFSSVAIVDVTGERPNCFIELGYALRGNRVLVTAEEGTKLPFDQEMVPCHFWKPGDSVADRKKALVEFWKKNINRPPIVKMA